MSLIIPGVSISVIRELVPRPLGATGILGIVGPAENDLSDQPLVAFGSLQEFREAFGTASLASLPEVKQAFANGLRQVVVANTPATAGAPAQAIVKVDSGGNTYDMTVSARANGAWGNALSVRVLARNVAGAEPAVDVLVFMGDDMKRPVEAHRNLAVKNNSELYFVSAVNAESGLIHLEQVLGLPVGAKVEPKQHNPEAPPVALTGGLDPTPDEYAQALTRLESFGEVDMVTASHQMTSEADATAVWAAVRSHCDRMSRIARNRVGFGQILPAKGKPDFAAALRMASTVISERFVLVAPNGYMGAVIGTIADLDYFQSPTFKPLGGVASLDFDFTDTQLEALLKAGVLPVDRVARKGIAIVHGITTSREQINVTRVADRAVRHVQNIAQDFIGLLNTEEQRLALKQRISEAFTRMEAENAIVPSTDGKSPAFAVDVASSQADFAQGIVRVHVAVRPVRAIDYIYATIRVQAF
ncbi:MAG TPA: phage tail sheath subtilisin-like domain-containing protein [Symbiobacteriaceae bacterium]|nr:phage tail sheath subtilisin-like domain-containing protein [Symbiobacteriaceae bacterium]